MTRRRRIWKWIGASLVTLTSLLSIVGIEFVRSAWFADYVSRKIVSITEDATGGRLELGSFAFDWRHLEARLTNVVLHGKESSGDPPLLRVDTIEVQLKLLPSWHNTVDLRYLGVVRPVGNVIVFPDGTTNIPKPKIPSKSAKSGLETIVDLAIHHFDLKQGTVNFAEKTIPLELHGRDLRAELFFSKTSSVYSGTISFNGVQLSQPGRSPIEASVKVPIIIAEDRVEINNGWLATKASSIALSGSFKNPQHPIIEGRVVTHVSLTEIRQATGFGEDACRKGAPCSADVDIEGRITPQAIAISKASFVLGTSHLDISGQTSSAHVDGSLAMDEIGRLFQFSGDRIGDIQLAGVLQSTPNRIDLREINIAGLGGRATVNGSLTNLKTFDVQARVSGFSLADLEHRFVSPRQGFEGDLVGTVDASGDLTLPGMSGIDAQANIDIAPQLRGIPLKGRLEVNYDGATNQVKITRATLSLPHSHLTLAGILGVRVEAELATSDTQDFYPLLAITMKDPPLEIPITFDGGRLQVRAHAEGPLSSPSIDGKITANRFAVEKRSFDGLDAEVTASQAGFNILAGLLTRGTMQASFSGSVGLRKWALTQDQLVRASLELRNGELPDLLALAGESAIPATGRLAGSVQVRGTVGNPLGAINVNAIEGSLYGEPYRSVDLQATMQDQLVRLTRAEWIADAGSLQASGRYTHPRDTLLSGDLSLQATSTQIRLNAIANQSKQLQGMDGTLQMNLDAAAKVQQAKGQLKVLLTSIRGDLRVGNMHDKTKSYGNVTIHADTNRSAVNFRADSDLSGSSTHLSGETILTNDYPTTADVSVKNLALEKLPFDLGLSTKGTVAIVAHAQGTVSQPAITAQLSLVNAMIANEPITRIQASGRYTANLLDISSLQITAPAGSLALNGSFAHPSNEFGSGTVQLHIVSSNLGVDKINSISSIEPGLAGTLNVSMDAIGDLKTINGQREIIPHQLNATAALSGLSYAGRKAGNAKVVAKTSGGNVAFSLDSDIAHAAFHGQGDVKLSGDYPISAQFSATDVRFANLRQFLNDESISPDFDALTEIEGTISGSVRNLDQIKADVRVPRLEAKAKGRNGAQIASLALRNDGPIEVQLDHSVLTVRPAHIVGPRGTDIAIAGTIGLSENRPLNLTMKSSADLALLQDIDRDIYSGGSVAINAAVRGSFSAPIATGSIQLKNASVNLAGISNGISNANGTIVLNGSRASITNLSGESGGGKITLAGFAAYTDGSLRYTLRASANRVRTRQQGVSIINNAALVLNGTPGQGIISGTITVVSVGLNPQSDLGSLLSPSPPPDASGEQTSPFLANTRLDIRIRTAPDVRFQSTLAEDLQAEADLSLVGALSSPGMTGRITVSEGNLIFFGNQYTVNHGVISFYNPLKIDPQLDVSLETTVESVDVVLTLKGPMNNLKLSYRSDPPLRFDEVVGLLAAGRQPTSDPTLVANELPAPQQSVGQMGESAIVSQAIASPVSSRLQRVFGITQLKIDPTFVSGSALPQASLTLQQRVANNVTFTYTQDYSQANSELVRVEWALSPRFSAVATRDINGIFGVDFFYKKQFR